MINYMLDDINELLLKGKGNSKFLKQIKRALQRDEVISYYERQYVQELVEKYLKPKSREDDDQNKKNKDTALSTTNTSNMSPPFKEYFSKKKPKTMTNKKSIKRSVFNSKFKTKKNKLIFLIAGMIFFVIVTSAVTYFLYPELLSEIITSPNKPDPIIIPSVSQYKIETDTSSYSRSDIISINGISNPDLDIVKLSIINPNNEIIWREDIIIKDDNTFSTLVIAGGQGWEDSGEYKLQSFHGDKEFNTSFNFRN